MYGLTRGPITLIAAGVAGLLIWLATQIDPTTGGYWAAYAIVAGAGFLMAFSQVLGGWTKWGWPHISFGVFLIAFVPAFICGGWVLVAGQGHNTTQSHVLSWSNDIGLGGLVNDLVSYGGVIAFGLGLLLGFSIDTKGPRREAPTPELRDWHDQTAAPPAETTTTPAATTTVTPATGTSVEPADHDRTHVTTVTATEPEEKKP